MLVQKFNYYTRWKTNTTKQTRGPWATVLTWMNSYKSLIKYVRLSVAMATNQNEEFVELLYGWWRTIQQTFIKIKFFQNNCSEIAIKTYFHLSHYKSVETLSSHSNKSTWATPIKNKLFVEANVMNISAQFQLHPLMASTEIIFEYFFSQIYPFSCHGNQLSSAVWTKFVCLVKDYTMNIFVNSCHNNQSSYPIGTKKK